MIQAGMTLADAGQSDETRRRAEEIARLVSIAAGMADYKAAFPKEVEASKRAALNAAASVQRARCRAALESLSNGGG